MDWQAVRNKLTLAPFLQQRKMFRVRGHLRSHLWEGFLWTLKVKSGHLCGVMMASCGGHLT